MFYCRHRRRTVSLDQCLDGYLNANAFPIRGSACWRCVQGWQIRRDFAAGKVG